MCYSQAVGSEIRPPAKGCGGGTATPLVDPLSGSVVIVGGANVDPRDLHDRLEAARLLVEANLVRLAESRSRLTGTREEAAAGSFGATGAA
jgi:hypothetical protein